MMRYSTSRSLRVSLSNERKALLVWVGVAVLCLVFSVYGLAQISVSGKLAHKFTVDPGCTYSGEIIINHSGEAPIEVQVTQNDYMFFADGTNTYGEPGSVPRSNSPWISLALPSHLILVPGERVSIPYTIEVPDDPSLVGTYWSIVMVAGVLPAVESPEGKIAIRHLIRYGIQIITHIGDSGERKINIIDTKLLQEEEGPTLQIKLENVGERYVAPQVWTELYDDNGSSVGRFESPKLGIYPGCSVRHQILLVGVPTGKYEALVVFDNGDQYVWGAQYTLEL